MPKITLDPSGITERLITAEEFFRMGEAATMGIELVDGKLVGKNMPTGHRHGHIEAMIAAILIAFMRTAKQGKVLSGEVGIFIRRNPDAIRAADVAFISDARFTQVRSDSYLDVAPELVVEVMSSADTWSEVKQKLRDYFTAGVIMAWIVDPATESITVYNADGSAQEHTAVDMLVAETVLPGFAVRVAEIFE